MINFARADSLEVALSSYERLVDVLLNANVVLFNLPFLDFTELVSLLIQVVAV